MSASGRSSLCEVDGSNKDGDGISDGWWVDGDAALNQILAAFGDDSGVSREGGGDEGSAAAAAAMSASVAADIGV
ncbi:hypothetical protein Tco_0903941 [Tanacetum coccineum]